MSAENCVGPRLLPCPKPFGHPLSFHGATLGVKKCFSGRTDALFVVCGGHATEVPSETCFCCALDVLRIMMLHFGLHSHMMGLFLPWDCHVEGGNGVPPLEQHISVFLYIQKGK